jgi:cardiolipin synthase
MRLVRRNSHSALTTDNIVVIQQDAAVHYPSLIADLQGARYAIYLQYYIWADDPFTQELKAILIDAVKRALRCVSSMTRLAPALNCRGVTSGR